MKLTGAIGALILALALVGTVSAAGYGTSSISLSSNSANVIAGNAITVNYTVNLASGSTWGTTLNVQASSALASRGIKVDLSNTYGEPPYSGTMSVSTNASTAPSTYAIILQATGDDPSVNNASFVLTVLSTAAPIVTTVKPNSSTINSTSNATTPATAAPTIAAPTTATPTTVAALAYPTHADAATYALYAIIIIAIIAALAGLFAWKSAKARLAIIGAVLIVIGIAVWLYGDYSGGVMQYIAAGLTAVIIGTLVWLYGDIKSGAYRRGAGNTTTLSVALIIAGIIVWLYGDYYSGGFGAVWAGVALIAIGVLVWLYGNVRAGHFGK